MEHRRLRRARLSDLRVEVEDIFADGDRVAMRWRATGTNDGELMGNPPTGKSIAITGMTIDRFDADGKLAETWDQWDSMTFMQQLGMAG